jgi:hypothetical protein
MSLPALRVRILRRSRSFSRASSRSSAETTSVSRWAVTHLFKVNKLTPNLSATRRCKSPDVWRDNQAETHGIYLGHERLQRFGLGLNIFCYLSNLHQQYRVLRDDSAGRSRSVSDRRGATSWRTRSGHYLARHVSREQSVEVLAEYCCYPDSVTDADP